MTVDIIILTYNRAHLIKKTIKSILEQSYTDIRLIISDDCSIDNTLEVIESFDDDRIEYIKNETNLGFINNWIQATNYVKSSFFMPTFGDDDYFVDMDFIKDCMKYFKDDAELDIIMCKHNSVFGNSVITHALPINLNSQGIDIVQDYNKYMKYIDTGIFRSKFTKYITNSIFDLKHVTTSNEYVIFFDIFLHAKGVKFLDKAYYHWVRDEIATLSNINTKNIYYAIKNDLSIAEHLYPYLEKKDVSFDYVEMFNKHFLYSFEEITMNYYLSKDNYLSEVIDAIDLNKDIYIYGKGEVGMKLNKLLIFKSICIKNFIDDVNKDDNVIKLDELSMNKNKKIIIIASYKNSQIISIMKKIIATNIKCEILTLIN